MVLRLDVVIETTCPFAPLSRFKRNHKQWEVTTMRVQETAVFSADQDKTMRWRRVGIGLLTWIPVVLGIAAMDARADSPTRVIQTTSGPVRGSSDGVVNKFQGIRYANSTAAANRWTPPTAPAPSPIIFDATTPGSACPQVVNQFSAPPPFNEDCLFLNVTTPIQSDGDGGLPVWIFIHGGALVNGEGAAFDPSVLVSTHKLIVVTINYRLGALGWLAHPALDGNGIAGNYGLMDQQLAFKWVRDNIARFGGNPNHVTIGGESAGGLSTSSNLASPTASGLFHAAIIESGAYMLFNIQSVAAQEALGVKFATTLGCTGTNSQVAACLRAQTVAAILAAQGIINTSPTSGTTILPQGLSDAFGSGNFNRVPVMQGTNLNEGTLFEPFFFDPTFTFVPGGPAQALVDGGKLTYPIEVGIISGTTTDPTKEATLANLYPPANFPNPDNNNKPSADEALGQIFTDVTFTCRGFDSNQLLARFVPVHAYEFADPNAPDLFQPLIGFSYGASHAAELQYLFDAKTLQGPADAAANAASPAPGAKVQPPPLTPGGTQLAAEMKAYWANFVRFHDPNGREEGDERDDHQTNNPNLAFWPAFGQTGSVQKLVPGPEQPFPFTTFSAEHNCDALTLLGLIK
jgi:para-nitrobenzyl esterase